MDIFSFLKLGKENNRCFRDIVVVLGRPKYITILICQQYCVFLRKNWAKIQLELWLMKFPILQRAFRNINFLQNMFLTLSSLRISQYICKSVQSMANFLLSPKVGLFKFMNSLQTVSYTLIE